MENSAIESDTTNVSGVPTASMLSSLNSSIYTFGSQHDTSTGNNTTSLSGSYNDTSSAGDHRSGSSGSRSSHGVNSGATSAAHHHYRHHHHHQRHSHQQSPVLPPITLHSPPPVVNHTLLQNGSLIEPRQEHGHHSYPRNERHRYTDYAVSDPGVQYGTSSHHSHYSHHYHRHEHHPASYFDSLGRPSRATMSVDFPQTSHSFLPNYNNDIIAEQINTAGNNFPWMNALCPTHPTQADSVMAPNMDQLVASIPTSSSNDGSMIQHSEQRQDAAVKPRRRKVRIACLYCARSHMVCDGGRPCQRCIKRNIANLCTDNVDSYASSSSLVTATSVDQKEPSIQIQTDLVPIGSSVELPTLPIEDLSNESKFSVDEFAFISDFLRSFNSADASGDNPQSVGDAFMSSFMTSNTINHMRMSPSEAASSSSPASVSQEQLPVSTSHPYRQQSTSIQSPLSQHVMNMGHTSVESDVTVLPAVAAKPASVSSNSPNDERYIVHVADMPDGEAHEILDSMLRAKYESGLLRPYDYARGYNHLQRFMETRLSPDQRSKFLQTLNVIIPSFRSVAEAQTDMDALRIEEDFERLVLEYDRVFTSIGTPGCLWRRTGEIYRSNRELAALIDLPHSRFSPPGSLCIFDIMTESSVLNYFEKYGRVAFDNTQKAVLTECVLRHPERPEVRVQCCFSFTIRRDRFNVPFALIGNFMPTGLAPPGE